MRIFVYEYLSSGAAGESSSSLRSEGEAMRAAVLEDLSRCPSVETTTLLAADVPAGGEEERFRTLAAAADWSLVIAPEFDDILEERSRWVAEAGGRLLGSSLPAIHTTADKLALLNLWQKCGIPTPGLSQTFPLVCKPRFGAGSQATFLLRNAAELERAHQQARGEGWRGELMQQAYVPGLPASVAFLGGERQRYALPAVEQRLSEEGRFRYRGGRLPLPEYLDRRARRLAEQAVRPVEGLCGWFGVDLVFGAADDGSADMVLEINPRLTTSYVGLRRLARFNLAEALLAVAAGSLPPSWQWRRETIIFQAAG